MQHIIWSTHPLHLLLTTAQDLILTTHLMFLFRDVTLLHLISGLIMDTLYVTLLQVLAEMVSGVTAGVM